MPVNPVMSHLMRRNWPLLGAALVLLVLVALHGLVFVPTERRYARAIAALGGMDAVLDPNAGPVPMPPRVFALVAENALPEADLTRRVASGQLTVAVIEELAALATRAGLKVTLSEPGPVAPQPSRVEATVHLKVRGSYRQIVAFLDLMRDSGRIYDLDRYEILRAGPELQMELWAVRMLLRQPEARR